MAGSTILFIVLIAIVVAMLGLWAYRRSATPTSPGSGESKTRNQVEQWGVRIAAAAKERACPRAQELLGKEFPMGQRPPLPLPDCPYPQQCECHYVKLFDRRRDERRSGQDRRQAQRFDKDNPPRRGGKDRRKNQIYWI